jgi:16S rRNA (cytosine967-C5)-methyltransferase
VQELCFGVVRWQGALDWLIAKRTDGRTQNNVLQILLRLGLYQLFWLDRIPDHAAVHETVQMARELGFGPKAGFVNALLRGCLRERESLERELAALKEREPHVGYSHPQWLYERWERRWGREKARTLLEWNNTPPPVFARVNTLKASAEQLVRQFETEGVLFTPRAFDWCAGHLVFELRSHPPLASLASFQQGFFYVQDPSTLLAVNELDPQPGEAVLDLCAAPGGKTTFIAQLMRDQGTICARDSDGERLKLVRENCDRLGVTCVMIGEAGGPLEPETPARFDRILVDAPCSNTGVMRRRVDLRWRIQHAEIQRLRRVQVDLLGRAAAWLKPGGTLVYSTCSLEPEENGDVVREYLAIQSEFRLENERELIPFMDAVDGAYVAKLRRP